MDDPPAPVGSVANDVSKIPEKRSELLQHKTCRTQMQQEEHEIVDFPWGNKTKPFFLSVSGRGAQNSTQRAPHTQRSICH